MGCLQTNSYSELPKIDYSSITQFSRTFYKDLREFRYLRLMGLYAQTPENSVRQFAITFLGLIGSNP